MIKLKVDSKRNLSFIERDRILQGEHKFDTLQIALPEKIDSNDEYVSGMLIKIFFVHDKDRVTRQVIPDQNLNVETVIDYTLTEKTRRWLVYVCFYKIGDEDIEVGKTNPVAVSVNHIPYNEALDIKSKDPDILLFKGDKGDKGDPGKDGVDGKDGIDGKDGKDGEQGPQGEKGDKGDKGDPGKDGTDGVGIADVHIDGGGDLIIETTDGHMENVGHVVGADGQDYVLTNQDKTDIANIVLQLLPTTQGVLYGNASN